MSEQIENPQTDRAAAGGMSGELREHLHRREEVCRKLEELPAAAVEDYSAELASLEAAWNDLPEVPPEYAEILDKRFAAAVKAANDAPPKPKRAAVPARRKSTSRPRFISNSTG